MPKKVEPEEPVGDWRLVCSWRDDGGRGVVHLSELMHSEAEVRAYHRTHRAFVHDGTLLAMSVVRYSDGHAKEVDVWHPSSADHRWNHLDAGEWRSSEGWARPEAVLAGIRHAAEVLAANRPDPDQCAGPTCTRPAERYAPDGTPWCELHRPPDPPPAPGPELDPERPFTEEATVE